MIRGLYLQRKHEANFRESLAEYVADQEREKARQDTALQGYYARNTEPQSLEDALRLHYPEHQGYRRSENV